MPRFRAMTYFAAGDRRASVSRRRASWAPALALRLTALLVTCAPGGVLAQTLPIPSDSEIDAVSSRRLSVDFRVEANTPLSGVEVWCTTDLSRTWMALPAEFTDRPPVIVEAPQEGLHGLYLVLRNAVGASSPPPQIGTAPHLWLFVDAEPPIVQVQSVALDRIELARADQPPPASRGPEDRILIRYAAYDAHFRKRPIDIEFRLERQTTYQPIAAQLENTGRFEWRPPDALSGRIRIRVLAHDRGGNVQTAESATIELPPPRSASAAISTRDSTARRDLPDTPPAETAVTDVIESALFRLTALDGAEPAMPDATRSPKNRAAQQQDASPAAASAALQAARRHAARGELALAETRLTELVTADPRNTDARLMLADVLSRRRQWSPAENQYRESLRQQPDLSPAHAGLALVLAHRRDYRGARDALTVLQRLRPDDPEILMHLGDMHALLGDFAAGRAAWRRAAESSAAADLQDRIRRRLLIYREPGLP